MDNSGDNAASVEFSRGFTVDKVGSGGARVSIAADAAECVALAVRFGIPAVRSLTCDFELARGHDVARAEILAKGRLVAVLVQTCVISLDEFEETMRESFDVRFVREGTQEEEQAADDLDEIPYSGGQIDLGEAAAEQVALDLAPYPRKPGATLPDEAVEDDRSPFAALKARAPR